MKLSFLPAFFIGLAIPSTRLHAASSLILSSQGGWNGFFVQAEVKAGFRRAGDIGGPSVSRTGTGGGGIYQDVHAPGDTITMSASATQLPDSGETKDKAYGNILFTYIVGNATTADTFSIAINSATSAINAMMNLGAGLEAVDSFVEVRLLLQCYGPLTGARLGLPGLPLLTATGSTSEYMDAVVSGPVDASMLPGDPSLEVPLTLGPLNRMQYNLTYLISTPYGEDPVISYTITGGNAFVAVPEPAVIALMGLLCVGMIRRRPASVS